MRSSHVAAALALALSATARADAPVWIPRDRAGLLPPGAQPADVVALLVAGPWTYLAPDKRTSTWESKTLSFDPRGTVATRTAYAWGPQTVDRPFRVVRGGPLPAIEIDRVNYALRPCAKAAQTTCLVGPVP